MPFEDIVDQAIKIVQRRGQVTYRMLERQFELGDASFEALKEATLVNNACM